MWVAFEIDWAVVIPSIRSAPQKTKKRVRHKIFSSRSPLKRALLSTSDMLRLDAFYAIPRQYFFIKLTCKNKCISTLMYYNMFETKYIICIKISSVQNFGLFYNENPFQIGISKVFPTMTILVFIK